MIRVAAAAACALALAACDGEDGQEGQTTSVPDGGRGSAPPPPDAGTARGHAADPSVVAVPDRDRTPPTAVVSLQLPDGTVAAEVKQGARPPVSPPTTPPETVRLDKPRMTGAIVGIDEQSGVPRVRVSTDELVTCRLASGETAERRWLRHYPPSQIERIRSSPGARIPVRETRSVRLELGLDRCPAGATAEAVRGELWGDATNGLGLEAVTPHIRFEWSR